MSSQEREKLIVANCSGFYGDKVTALPEGFKVICSNDATPIAGMADESRHFYENAALINSGMA